MRKVTLFNMRSKRARPFFKDMPKFNSKISFKALFNDADRDKMPDIIDCSPRNPKKQGVKPNAMMQQRINKLPVYITSKNVSFTNNRYNRDVVSKSTFPLSSKQANPKIKQQVYSTFKKYPQLITQIEKSKPKSVVFTKNIERTNAFGFATDDSRAVIRTKDVDRKGLKGTREVADTTSHELKHIRQKYTGFANRESMKIGDYADRTEEVSARKEGIKTRFSRSDINKKIAKRDLDKNKKVINIEVPASKTQYYTHRYSSGYVKKRIEEHDESEQQQAEESFRETFKENDYDES